MSARRYAALNQLTVAEAAYLAGLIDGEGTVTLTTLHRGENRRLVLSIASTERNLLEHARTVLGAGIITSKRTQLPHHAPSFAYRLTNRLALEALRQIEPYLCGYKGKRARLALRHYVALTPRNGKYSEATKQARERFEMAFLNVMPATRACAKGGDKGSQPTRLDSSDALAKG